MLKRITKPKVLNVQPLSLVKFFYQKFDSRILDQAFLQPLLYLTYTELLKKENILLFKEEFRAWESNPVLESIFWKLPNEEKELKRILKGVEDINHPILNKHLENISKKYSKLEACDLQFQAKNEDYQKAYENGFIKLNASDNQLRVRK